MKYAFDLKHGGEGHCHLSEQNHSDIALEIRNGLNNVNIAKDNVIEASTALVNSQTAFNNEHLKKLMSKNNYEEIQEDIALKERVWELIIQNEVTQESTRNLNDVEVEDYQEVMNKKNFKEIQEDITLQDRGYELIIQNKVTKNVNYANSIVILEEKKTKLFQTNIEN